MLGTDRQHMYGSSNRPPSPAPPRPCVLPHSRPHARTACASAQHTCDGSAGDPLVLFPHGSPTPSKRKDANSEQMCKMEVCVSLVSVTFKSSQSNSTRKQLTGEQDGLRAVPTCAAGTVPGSHLSWSPGPTGSSRAVSDASRKGPQLPTAPGLDRPRCQRQPVLFQPLNQTKVWAPTAAPPARAFSFQGPSTASPRRTRTATPATLPPEKKCRKPSVTPHSEVLLPSPWRGPGCRSQPVHRSHRPSQ